MCEEHNCYTVNWRIVYSRYSKCVGSVHGTLDVLDILTVLRMYWRYSRYFGCILYNRGNRNVLDIFAVL
jgi:hypothetical protein